VRENNCENGEGKEKSDGASLVKWSKAWERR